MAPNQQQGVLGDSSWQRQGKQRIEQELASGTTAVCNESTRGDTYVGTSREEEALLMLEGLVKQLTMVG